MIFSKKTITILTGCLLVANTLFAFNRQDSLRGDNGRGRDWWDVKHYSLALSIDPIHKSINGSNTIQFKVSGPVNDSMQIDLQEPLILDSAVLDHSYPLHFQREGNVYWLTGIKENLGLEAQNSITLYYHGSPKIAVNPPWDGGLIWSKDSLGNNWVSVACQGLGASVWWPCKDSQGDEPDEGIRIEYLPLNKQGLLFVSNGHEKLEPNASIDSTANSSLPSLWEVHNPINTYDVSFYLGDYTCIKDTFKGAKGILQLSYYPLSYHKVQATQQFKQVKKMLEAFEYWMGPYPFYEDGYKIVEAPFLGMEHQSAIAYGNNYQQGYKGKDRSGTGVGLLFDFIIVHESGHEWFGNSITASDIADNWIHEGFTSYSETLFTEYWFGKEKAFKYCRGEWKNIKNDRPIIGKYGVQDDGSGDKYDKASALIHTIRLLMDDDEKFRSMLHQISSTFYHQQISSQQLEQFIISYSGLELAPVFEQYLRTIMIPELEWHIKDNNLEYRFVNIVPDFTLPIAVTIEGQEELLDVTGEWESFPINSKKDKIVFSNDYLIQINNK